VSVGNGTRNIGLDLLRIFACMIVVTYHFRPSGDLYGPPEIHFDSSWIPSTLLQFTKYNYLGADIFFLLSGFLIADSALRISSTHFATSRINRIFPSLIFCSILTMFFNWATSGIDSHDIWQVTGLHLFYNFTGASFLISDTWSLVFELRFYLLMYILLRIRKSVSQSDLVLFALGIGIFPILLDQIRDIDSSSSNSINLYLYFSFGILLNVQRNNHAKRVLFPLLLIGLLCLNMSRMRIEQISNPSSKQLLFVCLIAAYALLIVIFSRNFHIGNVAIANYIRISALMTYPLYLLHENLGLGMVEYLYKLGVSTKVGYSFAILCCIVISWFIVTFVEPVFRIRIGESRK